MVGFLPDFSFVGFKLVDVCVTLAEFDNLLWGNSPVKDILYFINRVLQHLSTKGVTSKVSSGWSSV